MVAEGTVVHCMSNMTNPATAQQLADICSIATAGACKLTNSVSWRGFLPGWEPRIDHCWILFGDHCLSCP